MAGLLGSSPIRFRSRLIAVSLKSESRLTTGVDQANTVTRQRASGEGPKFRPPLRPAGTPSVGSGARREKTRTKPQTVPKTVAVLAVILAVTAAGFGGDGWESNPPRTPPQRPANGFEDRVSDIHERPATSVIDQETAARDPLTFANGCRCPTEWRSPWLSGPLLPLDARSRTGAMACPLVSCG